MVYISLTTTELGIMSVFLQIICSFWSNVLDILTHLYWENISRSLQFYMLPLVSLLWFH